MEWVRKYRQWCSFRLAGDTTGTFEVARRARRKSKRPKNSLVSRQCRPLCSIMLPDESTGSKPLGTEGVRMSATGLDASNILDWRTWGDSDYVAARRLLLDELLVQGACLANTAIEKYIKAILVIQKRPVPHIHDPLVLYHRIAPGGTLLLDEQFLGHLVKAYALRYPDDLKPGFNIVLSQALLLDALDQSVFGIRSRFRFRNADGSPVTSLLDHLLDSKDARILTNNTAMRTVTQEELFNRPSAVFEMRILDNGGRLEAHYLTEKIKPHGFDGEALKPNK